MTASKMKLHRSRLPIFLLVGSLLLVSVPSFGEFLECLHKDASGKMSVVQSSKNESSLPDGYGKLVVEVKCVGAPVNRPLIVKATQMCPQGKRPLMIAEGEDDPTLLATCDYQSFSSKLSNGSLELSFEVLEYSGQTGECEDPESYKATAKICN